MKMVILFLGFNSLFCIKSYSQSNDKGDSIAMELFKSAAKVADTDTTSKNSSKHYSFNPHAKEFEYIENPTPFTTKTTYFNSRNQPLFHKIARYFTNNLFIILGYTSIVFFGFFLLIRGKRKSIFELNKKEIKQFISLFFLACLGLFTLTGGFGPNDYLQQRYIENTNKPIWGNGSEIRWETLFPCSFLFTAMLLAIVFLFAKQIKSNSKV